MPECYLPFTFALVLKKVVYMMIQRVMGLVLCCLFISTLSASAQDQKVTISGYVAEESSGERLIGANIYELKSQNGTVTNNYGYFNLSVPRGQAILKISYVGHGTIYDTLNAQSDQQINYQLSSTVEMEEVTVKGERSLHQESQMSKMEMPVEEIDDMPQLFGEADVMRVAKSMPGIQGGNEASSGLHIRGGSPDQNLILLDGVPLYHASHLGGFFSVFNSASLKNMEIYKGGFPARYGNRLSSVIDIRMKDGNMKEFHGEGSLGLLSSRLMLEGPIVEDKTSFMFSGRRTFLDLLSRPFGGFGTGDLSIFYYFYDVNAKLNHKFSDKDRLYASFYNGDDRTTIEQDFDGGKVENLNAWGNLMGSLRWNHVFNQELFANFTANYSRYRFKVDIEQNNRQSSFTQRYESNVKDYFLKADFEYQPHPDHSIRFGAKSTYHTFTPGSTEVGSESSIADVDTSYGSDNFNNMQYSLYAQDKWNITPRLEVNAGLRGAAFRTDNNTYYSAQPRISGRYLLNEESSIKASYAEMQQFVHLLSSSGAGLPTDLWVPSTDNVKPQQSRQVAAGYSRTLFEGRYKLNIEGFYKTMDNLITYEPGANFLSTSSNWQENVRTGGSGRSYGAELRFQRKTGNTTGWISYTLSKSTRKFDQINFGERYPYRYDRRHNASVVVNHQLNKHIDLSLRWSYQTGNALTLPYGHYSSQLAAENEVSIYQEKNGFRARPYHRLDLSANFTKDIGWAERTWNVSVYNAYNRQNPFFYYFKDQEEGNRQLFQTSLFPVLPSVSYSLKF
jgi:outer membrane receptor for ferrienterochelin and colicin